MNKQKLKKWYLILSFILSLYLLVIMILGFTSFNPEILKTLNTIGYYILALFAIELIVLFIMSESVKTFFKEQWIGIIAVMSSLSVTLFVDVLVGISSLTGLKALKGVKALKSLKTVKGMKVLKATKGAKVAKTVKIGKKAKKAVKLDQ